MRHTGQPLGVRGTDAWTSVARAASAANPEGEGLGRSPWLSRRLHGARVPGLATLLLLTLALFAATLTGTSPAAVATCLAPRSSDGGSEIEQDTSYTIDRPATDLMYRVLTYGDSLFSGFIDAEDPFRVAKRAAPWVYGEYASNAWNADVEVVRRSRSGASAQELYTKILNELVYVDSPSTRTVILEMCGTDYEQARENFLCDLTVLNDALVGCTPYIEQAMQAINQHAQHVEKKVVANLYYPGYAADALTRCTDPQTAHTVTAQDAFLTMLARSNWRTCHLAEQYGFVCADSFAELMGADQDSNGDGQIDSEALHYKVGEPEDDYVARITVTLRSTIRDPETYLLADDTHPSFAGADTIELALTTNRLTGCREYSGGGAGGADFSDGQIVEGKNPEWNHWGHERLGWALSVAALRPAASPTASPTTVPTATPTAIPCAGDCNGNGAVTVDELLTLVNIALGSVGVGSCVAGDANQYVQITIDEILRAVNNVLVACPEG